MKGFFALVCLFFISGCSTLQAETKEHDKISESATENKSLYCAPPFVVTKEKYGMDVVGREFSVDLNGEYFIGTVPDDGNIRICSDKPGGYADLMGVIVAENKSNLYLMLNEATLEKDGSYCARFRIGKLPAKFAYLVVLNDESFNGTVPNDGNIKVCSNKSGIAKLYQLLQLEPAIDDPDVP